MLSADEKIALDEHLSIIQNICADSKMISSKKLERRLEIIGNKSSPDEINMWMFCDDDQFSNSRYRKKSSCHLGQLSNTVFSQSVNLYSVCSVPRGFVILGGAIRSRTNKFQYMLQLYCRLYISMQSSFRCNKIYDLPPMSEGRIQHGSEFVGNKLYVFGGRCFDPTGVESVNYKQQLYSNSVVALDFVAMDWKEQTDMPEGVINPQSFVVGNEIYVLGYGSNTTSVESHSEDEQDDQSQLDRLGRATFLKYNTFRNIWYELEKAPFSLFDTAHMQGIVHDGEYFTMGQVSSYRYKFASYNISSNQWSLLGEDIQHYGRMCMMRVQDILFCICTPYGGQNQLWEYDDTERRLKRSHRLILPSDLSNDPDSVLHSLIIDILR